MQFESANVLIHSLGESDVWDHPSRSIELIETHISWVVLTGRYAYKIKKPVDFGFVNFTTLERREFFCRQELRLNRRLAPDLYLDVVPITGSPENPIVNGSGTPIEFAVKMVQFPQEALLSHVLQQRQLRAEHIDRLAQQVADFHGRIARSRPDDRFGTPQEIIKPVEENFRHLLACELSASQIRQLRGLQEYSRREFAARQADFLNRKQGGFVRECHGDMHLGNMILWPWKDEPKSKGRARAEPRQAGSADDSGSIEASQDVLIFDCIEFNDSFRWIDVISEAAFVTMDLEDRGRADFSRRFLNQYLEHTGDYRGLKVMRFYLTYRALVRAKVDRLRAVQSDVENDERKRLGKEFQSYLDLADGYTRPAHPCLIITHGLSGAGKTSGTQPVVERTGAVRIRSDIERKRLFHLPDRRSGSGIADGIYSPQATKRTYEHLADLAASIVQSGFSVIVDATFLQRKQRDAFRALAGRLGVRFLLIDFQATEQALRQRLAKRQAAGADASEADLAVLEHQQAIREPLTNDETKQAIAVDTQSPDGADRLLAEVLTRVGQRGT